MNKVLIYSQEDLDLILELEKEKNEEIQQENQQLKEVIEEVREKVYEIDDLRKETGGYPSHYIDELLNILKEVSE